jgi:putative ABC transport system permease protein
MRRTILRLLSSLRPEPAESELDREIRSHLQLLEDKYVAEGMSRSNARYAARRAFGGIEQAKEHQRDTRTFRWLTGWSMDLKLGGRMLVKYPGLTVVGGLAMAFAICVGTVIFQVLSIFVAPSLPLPQADRLVQMRNWDVAANSAEPRALYDFVIWRSSLRSVTDLGAWRDVARNLIVTTGDARPVRVAEITPSAFRVADGTPLMGRVLSEADERPAAPSVAVIGYDIWRTRFGSDPAVLGRVVQLGTEQVTVVGVMREGFAFPIAHDVWTPLRNINGVQTPRSGPAISVFGLLAPGATVETAQAELTAVGQRVAIEQPATHAQLQPHLAPYAMLDAGLAQNDDIGIVASIYFFAVMLLVLVCSNVALLLFARAATRESELTMRTALGASRSRIVAQMFAEALVLGGVAAVVGLGAAHLALHNWGLPFLEANLGRLPFWYSVSLSPATVLFALGLTVLGSGIAGVIPALKVTHRMGSRLKQTTGGAGGLQFGGIWTVVIVVQVAFTVAFPAIVYQEQWQLRHVETFDAGFPAEEYLAARIELDTPIGAGENTDAAREAHRVALGGRLEELRRRVAAEPGVAGVTFVDRLPRAERPWYRVELPEDAAGKGQAGGPGDPKAPRRGAAVAGIDPSYFDALDTRVLAGRAFTAADLAPGTSVAIVDQGFVDEVLQGRNPIGQQVRFSADRSDPARGPNPWIEIVGVVKELGMGTPTEQLRAAGLYLPARPERLDRVYLMLHLRSDPLAFAPELREIASAVDPALRLSDVQRVDKVTEVLAWIVWLWIRITLVMTAVALVLSLSGIYAVLSFIVARRTREIGVRVALGADRRRVISAIFRRPLIQVGLGVLAGNALLVLAGSVKTEMPGLTGELSAGQMAILAAYGLVMLGVCLLACIVPTRRALSVEPTIALRMD